VSPARAVEVAVVFVWLDMVLGISFLEAPRSRGHYVYVGLEAIKVLALAAAGSLLLSN
jgi:hypothetical protein